MTYLSKFVVFYNMQFTKDCESLSKFDQVGSSLLQDESFADTILRKSILFVFLIISNPTETLFFIESEAEIQEESWEDSDSAPITSKRKRKHYPMPGKTSRKRKRK